MTAVPESFDGMLAELAEAAAAGVTMPDLADVRRRARQRTVHRRMTASAVAFALLCVSGVAGAAIDGRFRPPSKISPVSAPSASSGPLGASPALGAGTSTASPTASIGADGSYYDYAAFAGLWVGKPPNDYVVVFPDGVVALSQDGEFPLCYGAGQVTTSASPAANSTAGSGTFFGESAAGSTPSSGTAASALAAASSSAAVKSTLAFTADSCGDGASAEDELTLLTGQGAERLSLLDATNAKIAVAGYTATYARVLSIGTAHPGTDATLLARLAGQWVAADGTKRVLMISGDGSVDYTSAGVGTATAGGSGEIDAYYGSGARVLTHCSTAQETQMFKEGEDSTFNANQVCGVLLIESTVSSREITVYTSAGVEEFVRVD